MLFCTFPQLFFVSTRNSGKGSAVVKMSLRGHVENFWVHGHTLDRMNHMAHFALGRGNDLFDHLEVIISSLVEVSHNPELSDADRNILCRVAELLDVVLSRSHEDLFLPMECTLVMCLRGARQFGLRSDGQQRLRPEIIDWCLICYGHIASIFQGIFSCGSITGWKDACACCRK